jgi:DNA-binding NarL/FixJ family response regulator
MCAAPVRSGGDFLARKHEMMRARASLPALKSLLVVEDDEGDADRLQATLRLLLGYDVEIRRAATLGAAIDNVLAKSPELIFLDDVLKPADDAAQTIPFLRRAGYKGPIVVISGRVTRQRRTVLTGAGASDVIHKDDVDSARLVEALTRVLPPAA